MPVLTGRPKADLTLTDEERAQLQGLARSRSLPASLTVRAKIVLACAQGQSNRAVAADLRIHPVTVGTWRRRFISRRISGLHDELRPGVAAR